MEQKDLWKFLNGDDVSSLGYVDEKGNLNIDLDYSEKGITPYDKLKGILHTLGINADNKDSDFLLHGTRIDNIENFFGDGVRIGSRVGSETDILSTASLQSNQTDNYAEKTLNYAYGSIVYIINIPYSIKSPTNGKAINVGAGNRFDFTKDFVEQTSGAQNSLFSRLDKLGLSSIPSEFVVGAYYRDVNNSNEPGSGKLILNPKYIGLENNMHQQNFESLSQKITSAPNYQEGLIIGQEERSWEDFKNAVLKDLNTLYTNIEVRRSKSVDASFMEEQYRKLYGFYCKEIDTNLSFLDSQKSELDILHMCLPEYVDKTSTNEKGTELPSNEVNAAEQDEGLTSEEDNAAEQDATPTSVEGNEGVSSADDGGMGA